MELKSRTTGNITVAEMGGRFEALENAKVASWLDNLMAGDAARLVVNMSAVTFVDSSALSLLVKVMKICRQRHGDLIICGLQSHVRVIFDLTRLNKVFNIHNTEEEALRAFPS